MTVRLAVGQMDPMIGDMKGNMKKMQEILVSASDNNVDVLVLPELINSGYVFNNQDEANSLSEQIPDGDFSNALRKWSEGGGLIVAGLCEMSDGKLYNSAGVFGNGMHLTTYRKIQLFNKEKEWFLPGNEEPPVISHNGNRFGVMVCFDWVFPEISRILALKGAQVILHPANLVLPFCPDAMITRSIENRVFTATSGRTGEERDVCFIGGSQITTPKGELLSRMDEGHTGLLWADVELTEADNKSLTKRNDVFTDRRPELYSRIIDVP
ncbi:MAG: nitrilase-related carbon-nitrogen hydrolase [Candidatus Thorarchaeota archaeon]|jgi:predicted amidohydrolase